MYGSYNYNEGAIFREKAGGILANDDFTRYAYTHVYRTYKYALELTVYRLMAHSKM
jgi:hypothetical protein